MSKARNRSLFLRLGLVLAAEPGLRLAGYLLTNRAWLCHRQPFFIPILFIEASRSQLLSGHLVRLALNKLCSPKEEPGNCGWQPGSATVHRFFSVVFFFPSFIKSKIKSLTHSRQHDAKASRWPSTDFK